MASQEHVCGGETGDGPSGRYILQKKQIQPDGCLCDSKGYTPGSQILKATSILEQKEWSEQCLEQNQM